jgi:hypothetical protein
MTTLNRKGKDYRLDIQIKPTDSNYCVFASLYIGKEKTPSFGTSFKTMDRIDDILNWAVRCIDNPNIQSIF